MDCATNSASATARGLCARGASIVLGLLACVPVLGCSGMNPFARREPPLLGSPTTPGTTAFRPGPAGGNVAAGPTRVATASSDPYARSLGRPPADPAANATSEKNPATTEAPTTPLEASAPAEDAVRTTGLDAAPAAPDSTGVLLKPPVSPPAAPAATPDPTPTPSPSNSPENGPAALDTHEGGAGASVESLVAEARKRLDGLVAYQVEINRQERVGDQLQDPEDVVLSIRRDPKAVRLEWRQGPHKGREVLYSPKETRGLMEVNMADASLPLPRLALPPDSPLIQRTSRHPITEAGFDTIVGNLQKTIDENRAGDHSHGRISYAGLEQPRPLDHPCHKIVRVTANGETWSIYLDPGSKLPAMVEAHAAGGDLLECYRFQNVRPDPPELAVADAFDPGRRWGASTGLLGRLTGAAAARTTGPDQATTQ